MDTTNLIQAISSFYQTVIIVLVAILAAVISLVYLSIRASSRRQTEQEVEKDLEAPWFQDRLQRHVDSKVDASISEMAQRIEVLERFIAKKNTDDHSEDTIASEAVVADGGRNGIR